MKIARELKSKKISDWNIENALNQISKKDYTEKLKVLCTKQIKSSDKNKFELKNKIIRSLSYKGWEVDLIVVSLNQLIK